MTDSSRAVARALLEAGAFKVSLDPLFTWTSGLRSPVYCDLRALNSHVEARRLIVDAFVELVPGEVDVVAGTSTAGISWAAWLAEKLNKPMCYVRGSAKGHGTKKRVEGMVSPGQKVLVVEDLISTGGSSLRTIEALREECDAVVEHVVAINSYQFATVDSAFEAAGVQLHTVTNAGVIFEMAHEQGSITQEQLDTLADFREDPSTWAERHGLV